MEERQVLRHLSELDTPPYAAAYAATGAVPQFVTGLSEGGLGGRVFFSFSSVINGGNRCVLARGGRGHRSPHEGPPRLLTLSPITP